jgi:hypothetical protein
LQLKDEKAAMNSYKYFKDVPFNSSWKFTVKDDKHSNIQCVEER